MDKIFDNLFTVTNKNKDVSKVAKLELEVKRLQLCLAMSQEANQKRKDAMQIMMQRLDQQDALIKRLNSVLKNQDMAMAKMQETMRIQQERLAHIARIDIRMDNIQEEQSEILQLANQYRCMQIQREAQTN